jgi:ribulose-phosphate 3-epimerase
MTVNPGFAGQKMTPGSLRKIAACRRLLDEAGYDHLPIQVDGNVSFANIPGMVAAGAHNLVAGTSSIFNSADSWGNNLKKAREAIAEGLRQRADQTEPAEAQTV